MMDETDFHQRVDALLDTIEAVLETTDLDFEREAGILKVQATRGTIIINRQTPNREVWVAAKQGGFHFRWAAASWVDTCDGVALAERLSELLSLLGEPVVVQL